MMTAVSKHVHCVTYVVSVKAREAIEKSVMTRTEKEFQSRLQQLQNEHTTQLRYVSSK